MNQQKRERERERETYQIHGKPHSVINVQVD